jgi:hypothetical protein
LHPTVFRIVSFRLDASGDVQPTTIGSEGVLLHDSIRRTGNIDARAFVDALTAAARLVDRAVPSGTRIVAIASETLARATNSERFFAALGRHVAIASRIVVPTGVFPLPARPIPSATSRRGLVWNGPLTQVTGQGPERDAP